MAGIDIGRILRDALKIGTTASQFILKNSSGTAQIRNSGDSDFAAIEASKLSVSGDEIDLNSDAADSGADWGMTLRRPSTGMTQAITIQLPATYTAGDNLSISTFSGGVATLASTTPSGATNQQQVDSTAFTFGSSSPVAMFTLTNGKTLLSIHIEVTTAWDDAATTASIGISGNTSKYVPSTKVPLAEVETYIYPINAPITADENLIITLAGGSPTAGEATVYAYYAEPS